MLLRHGACIVRVAPKVQLHGVTALRQYRATQPKHIEAKPGTFASYMVQANADEDI
jgi:hypothetical protein